jgi:SAM-dependent methyltransferase
MIEPSSSVCLRHPSGAPLAEDPGRWLAPLAPADRRVLARARPPVLDVGCGPGRHVVALAEQRKIALGIDLTPPAVRIARRRGAPVLHRSVFAQIPGTGRWRTALLLDGNIGIGGDPIELLGRVTTLLAPHGRVLIEFAAPGSGAERTTARLELGAEAGPWFPWSRVPFDQAGDLAASSALTLDESWCDDGRWFASLRGSGAPPAGR